MKARLLAGSGSWRVFGLFGVCRAGIGPIKSVS
jgi:hypothetical protein